MQRRLARRRVGALLVTALGLLAAACGDQVVAPPPAPLRVVVAPAQLSLTVGQTARIVATVENASNPGVRFTSSDPTVVQVGGDGTVTALRAGAATIVVAALQDSLVRTGVAVQVRSESPLPGALQLTPSSPTIAVGQRVTLVATLPGGTAPPVRFSSTDAAVATVDEVGGVTGRAPGVAVIVARGVADTTIFAAAAVTVVAPQQGLGISIGTLRSAGGALLDVQDVRGVVSVEMTITPGTADSLQVLLGSRVVPECTQRFAAPSSAPRTLTCTIDTTAFDTVTGTPFYPNNRYSVVARLVRAGAELLSADAPPLTLRNADRFLGRARFTTTAADSLGRLWGGGDVALQLLPISYSGAAATGATVRLSGWREGVPVEVTRTATAGPDGLVVRFPASEPPAAGGVQRLNTGPAGTLPLIVQATIGGAAVGTQRFANADSFRIRVDNEPPLAGTVAIESSPGGFVGRSYEFAAGYRPAVRAGGTPADTAAGADAPFGVAGVGRVAPVFYAAPASMIATPAAPTAAEIAAVVARGERVVRGADLAAAAGGAYVLVAEVRDALGNASYAVLPRAFGVDLSLPTLTVTAPADSINPTEPFRFAAADSVSGVTGVRVSVFRLTRTGRECAVIGGAQPCAPLLLPGAQGELDPSRLPPGYYVVEAVAFDQAGNASAPFASRTLLVDPPTQASAPTITIGALPTLVGGQQAAFSARVRDDVDVGTVEFRQSFQLRTALPGPSLSPFEIGLTAPLRVSRFGVPAQTDTVVGVSVPFIRALQLTSTAGVPDTARTWVAEALDVVATDVAGNRQSARSAFAPAVAPGDGLPAGLRTFLLAAADQTVVCVSAACAGAPTQITVNVLATGPSGTFLSPFDRVVVYYTDRNGRLQPAGVAAERRVEDTPAARTRTSTFVFDAEALRGLLPAAGQSTALFALGVDAQGDALLSAALPVRLQ